MSEEQISPKPEKSLVRKPLSFLKWFSKETFSNWSYEQLGVLGRSAIMTTFIAFVVRIASTIPLDLILIAALFLAALIFFSLQRFIGSKRKALSLSETGETDTDRSVLQAAAPVKKVECPYQFTHNIAEAEELDLHKAVVIKEVNIGYELEDELKHIDFKFTVFNGSVYVISTLNEIEGYISFRKKRLMGNIQMERGLTNLSHASEGTIIIRLQLSREEADVISKADDRKIDYFYFDQLSIKVNGGRFYPKVQPARLNLPDLIQKGNDEEAIDKLTKQVEGDGLELSRLRKEVETLQVNIKMRDDEFNKYAWLHERANKQRQEISKYVILEEAFFCYQCLSAPERLRSVFALDIFNESVFDITIEDVAGHIEFEGTPLNEKPRIINKPIKVAPASGASITVEQPLTRGDADFIESRDLLFAEFNLEHLVISIKGSETSEAVQSEPLNITHPHNVLRINQTRKDIKELSARIKVLEDEKAARNKPDITGKIKGVYSEWWPKPSKNDSESIRFDYHFIINVYLANRGAVTAIEKFKVALKAGEHSYNGEKEKDAHDVQESEINWREWGATELEDLEKSNDTPLIHTRNGWLWFVVEGVPNTEDKSEMELELSVIDKDGTSYRLDAFPQSKWAKNPFLNEARMKEARARMQQQW